MEQGEVEEEVREAGVSMMEISSRCRRDIEQ